MSPPRTHRRPHPLVPHLRSRSGKRDAEILFVALNREGKIIGVAK